MSFFSSFTTLGLIGYIAPLVKDAVDRDADGKLDKPVKDWLWDMLGPIFPNKDRATFDKVVDGLTVVIFGLRALKKAD